MGEVWRDEQQSSIPNADDGFVEEFAVEPDPGKQTPIGIASLLVELEFDRSPQQRLRREFAGFWTETLHRLGRVVRLGSIDPQKPNGVHVATELDVDGVAIRDVDDVRLDASNDWFVVVKWVTATDRYHPTHDGSGDDHRRDHPGGRHGGGT